MKKLLVLLLALALIFSLAACGDDDAPEETKAPAPTEEVEPTDGGGDEPASADGTLLETTVLDITYSDDWFYDEEYTYEYDGSVSLNFEIIEDDTTVQWVDISLDVESPSYYRGYLNSAGIDAYDLVTNNTGTYVDIAGMQMLVIEGIDWAGDPYLRYLGRDESRSLTFDIDITTMGTLETELIDALLSSIVIKVEDGDLVDPPWFWEGTPIDFSGTAPLSVGGYTLTATHLKMDMPFETFNIFDAYIALSGNTLWLNADDKLYQYNMAGDTLSYIGEYTTPTGDTVGEIASDTAGNIYASDFISPMFRIAPDGMVTQFDIVDDTTAMHPSGTWGLSYFGSSDIEKVTINGDTVSKEMFLASSDEFSPWSIDITQNYILIYGSETADSTYNVRVYDFSGNVVMKLTRSDGSFGSITDIVETANGFIAIDGNFRELVMWDLSGNFIGVVDIPMLMGPDYCWPSSLINAPDGSLLICYTQERDDESGDEVLISRITGF